jgi:nicotinamide-nucleotide amidase
MHAEIVAVGTELTSGAKLDTNSQWLSLELAAVGIPVHFHTAVGDDLPEMVDVLRCAVDRADIVLITGGLGPTLDDLTRDALAQLMQCPLVLHEPSLEIIRSMFARRGIEMPERNTTQAMFPERSEPISNPRGTAPGIWAQIERPENSDCLIAAMPGVPSEMKRMFQKEVLPRLPGGSQVIRRLRINCFGLGESATEELLGELTARGRDPEVGITAHEATITLRIAAHGKSIEECEAKIAATRAAALERLGEHVFGEEDTELHHVVVAQLAARGLTLSSAEVGTGGLLAHSLTDVPGYEQTYHGGTIIPAAPELSALLGADAQSLAESGAISETVAGKMAQHCREQFGTDFALAITAFPPYNPEVQPNEAPTGYIALAGRDFVKVRRHVLIGDIAILKSRAAKSALDLLRRHLNAGQ